MLILGFDGMDPEVVRRLIARGDMPNMKKLADRGVFAMMRTSIPPQSPVAWGSFISGADPGVYGIFDFLHRDPKTYFPFFSESETYPGKWMIKLGKYQIPLKPGKVVLKREGKAFWDFLEERDIEATIFKVPTNYPPSPSSQRTLSGLGTPDIMGTYGIYSIYTSDEEESRRELSASNVFYAYVDENNIVDSTLIGPKNDLLQDAENVEIPFRVYVDFDHKTARIDIQGKEILLAENEYSNWVEVEFPLLPLLQSISGMVKFYLFEVGKNFRLYVSPIHINPADPALPISTPSSYSRELTDACGLFHTIALPADTKALSNGTFSLENFIHQSNSILKESEKLFDYELSRFCRLKQGLLFFYLSSLDQGQHMFWVLNDPQHPFYKPEEAKRFGYITEWLYRQCDAQLGKALNHLPPDVAIIAMSDHGFAPFHRRVNINTWLIQEGYLKLSNGGVAEGVSILEQADWGRSRAYALGLNGLYLNLRGREASGTVGASERRGLLEEIKAKLEKTIDPQNGERIINTAYISEDHFSKNHIDRAPDIILGFNRRYRISDESALGTLNQEVVTDNLNWWSGDHLMDPKRVPAAFVYAYRDKGGGGMMG